MVVGGTALTCRVAAAAAEPAAVAVAVVAAVAVAVVVVVAAVGGRRLLVCCLERPTMFWRLRPRWTGQCVGDVFLLPFIPGARANDEGVAVSSSPDLKWLHGKGRSIVNAVCHHDGKSDGGDGVEEGALSSAKPAMGESEGRGRASS